MSPIGEGHEDEKQTKYRWLMNQHYMSRRQWRGFITLLESTLQTALARAIKKLATALWGYNSRALEMKARLQ